MSEIDHKAVAEQAAGVTFNPNGRKDVADTKALFARIFELVETACPADDGTVATARARKIRDAALHEIITAQMWAVKSITWQ